LAVGEASVGGEDGGDRVSEGSGEGEDSAVHDDEPVAAAVEVDKLGSRIITAHASTASRAGRPESRAARIVRLETELSVSQSEKRKLETERDILRQSGEVFRLGDELVNRFQFVEDHKDAYGVKRLCEVIQIARSSFYAWVAAAPGRAARAAADAVLAERIRVLQDAAQGGDRAYGAPRITGDINVLAPQRVITSMSRG
jgi:hypothetical protein